MVVAHWLNFVSWTDKKNDSYRPNFSSSTDEMQEEEMNERNAVEQHTDCFPGYK